MNIYRKPEKLEAVAQFEPSIPITWACIKQDDKGNYYVWSEDIKTRVSFSFYIIAGDFILKDSDGNIWAERPQEFYKKFGSYSEVIRHLGNLEFNYGR